MRAKLTQWVLAVVLLATTNQVYGQDERSFSAYHAKLQYAGSIGFASVGIGRTYFQEKLETDVFLGHLPERIGGDRLWTAALKTTFVPMKPIPVSALDWQPVRVGLQVSHTFGEQFYIFEHHDKYPRGYYGFPTAVRLYLYLGGQVDFARSEHLSRLGLYYEVGSSAEYIISYIQNPEYLSLGKIFNLALGMRVRL